MKDPINLLLLKQLKKFGVDVANIISELRFDGEEIVPKCDMGNDINYAIKGVKFKNKTFPIKISCKVIRKRRRRESY